jgi:hypothetical protein
MQDPGPFAETPNILISQDLPSFTTIGCWLPDAVPGRMNPGSGAVDGIGRKWTAWRFIGEREFERILQESNNHADPVKDDGEPATWTRTATMS